MGQDDLQLCRKIWKELDNSQKNELEGNDSKEFVKRILETLLDKMFDESNLESPFKQEFGNIAPPPPNFFKKQKEDAKKQFELELWAYVDPSSTGKITWTSFVEFFYQSINQ